MKTIQDELCGDNWCGLDVAMRRVLVNVRVKKACGDKRDMRALQSSAALKQAA